MFRQVVATSG